MADKRRIVVVGLGAIGKRHARLLHERGDLQVEYVEPNPEFLAYAREHIGDLPTRASFDAALKTGPDTILIATPPHLHASQAIQALNAGVDVFCEKPMCDDLAKGMNMQQAAQSSGRTLNIGFNMHFHPALKMLKEIIGSNALGRIVQAHAWVGTYFTLVSAVSRHQADHPGSIVFDCAHQPDMLYWLLGKKPSYVYAAGLEAGNLELSSSPNVTVITCEYDDPLISSILLNYVQMPQRQGYEIIGDKGWAYLDGERNELSVGRRKDSTIETHTFTVERDDIFRAEHQAFLDTLAGKRPPETSAEDGLVSLAVCRAAMESWQTHQRIKLG